MDKIGMVHLNLGKIGIKVKAKTYKLLKLN